jgi:hypothetical protein
MSDSWFDTLVAKWIELCELANIEVDNIERARSFIDGDAYESKEWTWTKPPSLQALQAWYLAARDLAEQKDDGDELMSSELWRILTLTEKAYQMGLADAAAKTAAQ